MSVEKVKDYFKKYNMEDRVIELKNEIATVADAAKYLECDNDMIAKTLSFDVNGKTILIVASGNTRIDNSKYKQEFSTKAKMLMFEEVEQRVGHKVGGVCPFAIADDIPIWLDISMKRFKYVHPAGGNEFTSVRITPSELEAVTGAEGWCDVCKGWEDTE